MAPAAGNSHVRSNTAITRTIKQKSARRARRTTLTAATFVLGVGALGNLRTTTVKAFPENAYRRIVEAV